MCDISIGKLICQIVKHLLVAVETCIIFIVKRTINQTLILYKSLNRTQCNKEVLNHIAVNNQLLKLPFNSMQPILRSQMDISTGI